MANERRLIDMDETIKQLRDYADRKHTNGHNDAANGILNAVNYIRNNMVRVDAVEVVRCKDCKRWKHFDHLGCTDFGKVCGLANYMIGANGYCLYGEGRCE